MRVYVASSWRNEIQPTVVEVIRSIGHEVYDFKNPYEGDIGFAWKETRPDSDKWSKGVDSEHMSSYLEALKHPLAKKGFALDMSALATCEACVLVLPSGNSAHLEMGYCVARGVPTYVYCGPGFVIQPELMYKMCTKIITRIDELKECFYPPVFENPNADFEAFKRLRDS